MFCTLYTLPIMFSDPLYTDIAVYMLAIIVFSTPAFVVLTPHRLTEFAESSTMIFAMSLPNRAIGFAFLTWQGFAWLMRGKSVISTVIWLGSASTSKWGFLHRHACLQLNWVLREGILLDHRCYRSMTMHNQSQSRCWWARVQGSSRVGYISQELPGRSECA